MTTDPDGGDKDDVLSQNPYAYAKGNPVSNVDPDGEWSRKLTGEQVKGLRNALALYSFFDAEGYLASKFPTPGKKAFGRNFRKFMTIRKMLKRYQKRGTVLAWGKPRMWGYSGNVITNNLGNARVYVNGHKGPMLDTYDRQMFRNVIYASMGY